mmetsp:Transcript_67167/g.184228  ORF Transcript_67167/g.184228 Transcript_67167/m.184228 type:complete len:248 (+) Transcript_67167:232-975(+)
MCDGNGTRPPWPSQTLLFAGCALQQGKRVTVNGGDARQQDDGLQDGGRQQTEHGAGDPAVGLLRVAHSLDGPRRCEDASAHEGSKGADERRQHKHEDEHREDLVVVLQRPLRTVELADVTLGLHEHVSQLAPLRAFDLVAVLIRDRDLGCQAGGAEVDAEHQRTELEHPSAEVEPAEVERRQRGNLRSRFVVVGERDEVGDREADREHDPVEDEVEDRDGDTHGHGGVICLHRDALGVGLDLRHRRR